MPITRRRRANPPEQPENNNHQAEQAETSAEASAAERPVAASEETENRQQEPGTTPPATPTQGRSESTPPYPPFAPSQTASSLPASLQLSTAEQLERAQRNERSEYPTSIEGGRRTARGEFFRRPPQPPATPSVVPSVAASAPLQPPSHEITLPLGNLLHLAYNPGYTGSDEARSALLQHLEQESKAGGRARCWSCGSLAIVYDRWNTRSKTFGEVGIAFCEICGVWSIM